MSTVEIYNEPITGRLFVVGDIHGCYSLLMAELAKRGFDFNNDLLISVGDLIDRGLQNQECVGLIGKSWFKAVRGNHEQFCIEGFLDYNIARQHVMSNNGGAWFYQLNNHIQQQIVSKFQSLPIALEISFKGKKYGFVHAHVEQNDWEEFKAELNAGGSESYRSPVDMALWSRDRVYAHSSENQYQAIKNIDEVYLGHTVLPRPMRKHNCIFIDTGAFHTTLLTVIELKGEQHGAPVSVPREDQSDTCPGSNGMGNQGEKTNA
ncbi:metallophosphoesterase [Alkanindiges illinoisensis]|uniref:metallophosphoesterase n=1 Tax=Alkanindiges illinoisensis TaxID=197183 RepID=UPI0009FFFF29|nr:metallophosphoesterase [Alkanindiges illinoisensis]